MNIVVTAHSTVDFGDEERVEIDVDGDWYAIYINHRTGWGEIVERFPMKRDMRGYRTGRQWRGRLNVMPADGGERIEFLVRMVKGHGSVPLRESAT